VWNSSNETWDSSFAPRAATIPITSPNYIINGGFDIWQRGTSMLVGNGMYSADRWSVTYNYSGGATITASQSTVVPNTSLKYSLQHTTSGSATSIVEIAARYKFEAQAIQPTLGAPITVSFWYYSSVVGNHGVRFGIDTNNAGTFANNTAYTFVYPVANTWQKITQVFTNTTAHSLGTATPTAYAAFLDIGPNTGGFGQSSVASGSYWNIAGVQVEAGAAPTEFRRNAPSIQAELAACQRYYQVMVRGQELLCSGQAYAINAGYAPIQFFVPMRTAPALPPTISSASDFVVASAGGSTIPLTILFFPTASERHTRATIGTAGSLTAGHSFVIEGFTTSAFLAFSAEL
jgi:hypothetical protein